MVTLESEKVLNEEQLHRAEQILGFVNITMRKLPNKSGQGATEEEATYLIQAAMFSERDERVINFCESKFKKWYNY